MIMGSMNTMIVMVIVYIQYINLVVTSYRYSNEYEQYLKYIEYYNTIHNITDNDHNMVDKSSGNNNNNTNNFMKKVMLKIHQCNYNRLNYCGEETVLFINQHMSPLWNSTINISSIPILYKSRFFTTMKPNLRYKANIDCHYEIVDLKSYDFIYDSNVVLINIPLLIIQSQCINYNIDPSSSSSSSPFLLGGSSFEVTIENDEFFSNCGVIDYFNNTYHINCTIPLSSTSTISTPTTIPPPPTTTTSTTPLSTSGIHNSHQFLINRHNSYTTSRLKRQVCYNLTIIIDFEHYSAFSDFKLTPVKLRHYIIDNTIICRNISKLPKTLHQIHQLHEQLRGYYVKLPPPPPPLSHNINHSSSMPSNRDHQRMGAMPSYHSYYYLSKERLFPNKVAITRCFNDSHPLFMLGSSHMRFNFDHLVYSYYTTSLLATLEKSHGPRIQEGPLILFETLFSFTAANILRSDLSIIQACKSKTSVKIVLQTGIWDTFYWSPRNFLYNPNYGKAIIKSINYLIYQGCEAYIKIIYVTAVPETSNTIAWTNNYSTKVISQWLQLQFRLLNYSNFDVVDAFEIIYPTVTGMRHDHVCDNHYLCHLPYEDSMLQTVAGKAVLSSILHALCLNDNTHHIDNHSDDDNHDSNKHEVEGMIDHQHQKGLNNNNNDGPIYASQYTKLLQDPIIGTGTIIRLETSKDNTVSPQISTYSSSNSSNLSSSVINNTVAYIVSSTNNNIKNNSNNMSLSHSSKSHRKISTDSLFLIWNGLRRYIPIDTYNCYHNRDMDIRYVNKSVFKSIPIDISVPNMKDKHLLRGEGLKIYVITNCKKRFISSKRLKHDLNYTYLGYMLPNSLFDIDLADDYDMNDIPNFL